MDKPYFGLISLFFATVGLINHIILHTITTAAFILQECLRGTLKGKTIILVTHQVDFLHNVDSIFVS